MRCCCPSSSYLSCCCCCLVGSDDTIINFFNINTGKNHFSMNTSHDNNIFWAKDVMYSNMNKILSCAADGRVILTYSELSSYEHIDDCRYTGNNLQTFTPNSRILHKHRGRAHRLALHPRNPDEFFSCGEDGCLLSYDLRR